MNKVSEELFDSNKVQNDLTNHGTYKNELKKMDQHRVYRHFRCQRPPGNIWDHFIDLLLIIFIIGAWRAVWNLWDIYLFPYDVVVSSWIGAIGCILIVFLIAKNKLAAVV